MPPCLNGSQATVPAISPFRTASTRELDAVDAGDRHLAGAPPSARSASKALEGHVVVRGQIPLISSPNWVSHRLTFSSASVGDQLAT